MMWSCLRLLLSLGFAAAVGSGVRRTVFAKTADKASGAEIAGQSFALGLATIAAWMLILSVLSIPFSLVLILPLGLIPLCSWLTHLRGRCRGRSAGERGPIRTGECDSRGFPIPVLLAILVTVGVIVLIGSMAEPISEIDAVAAWAFHAKLFYYERTSFPEFMTSGACGLATKHWPPLHPLIQAWGHLAMGAYDDRLIKLLFPLFYLALLGIIYGTLARYVSRAYSLALLFVLATAPAIVVHFPSGSVASGLADVTLALFIAASACCLTLWFTGGSIRHAVLGGLFTAFAIWVKMEGLAFGALSVVAVWLLWLLGPAEGKSARALAPVTYGLLAMFSAVLLYGYCSRFPGPFTGAHVEVGHAFTVGGLFRFLQCAEFTALEALNPVRWGPLWILLVLLVPLRGRRVKEYPAVAFLLLLILGYLICAAVFMSVNMCPVDRHRFLNVRRVLIHVAPLATVAMGLLLKAEDTPRMTGCGPAGKRLQPARGSGMAPRAAIPKRNSAGPPYPQDRAKHKRPHKARLVSMIQRGEDPMKRHIDLRLREWRESGRC